MINKVCIFENRINNLIPFKGEPAQKEARNAVTNTVSTKDNNGLDILASYNYAIMTANSVKANLDIKPLAKITINPEDIKNMSGEKIYSSDGKLHSIIQRGENTYTIYTLDNENENMFSEIKTVDKKTGKTLLTQRNFIDDGNNISFIYKYDINTNKNILKTYYKNSDVVSASKIIYYKDGSYRNITKDFEEKRYYMSDTLKDKKGNMNIDFNSKKQINTICIDKIDNLSRSSIDMEFYNGGLTAISKSQTITVPNDIGLKYINSDKDLIPAALYKKPENIDRIEGEKTYYSNGAIETNTFASDNGKLTAHFNPDGTCYQIDSEKFSVIFDDEDQTIRETLDDNRTKISNLYDNGGKSVEISDKNSYKDICYNPKNIPETYTEGIIVDGENKETKWLSFDDKGILIYGRDYSI